MEHSWGEGYVVDVGYTHGFYRELTPVGLRFVTLLGAVQAVSAEAPFTYYELGCGNGNTSAVLAAANPQGEFIGVDFNPTHIHHAQQLAHAGGMPNLRFLEKSFAELLSLELPDAEIIAMHGIWSWISEENRRHIVEFIRRRLKPAGIVYVSYNCLPGLAQSQPLQRLLYEHSSLASGERMERVARSLDFANRLTRAGAEYFRANPLATARLESINKQDPVYVAHEYHNAHWSPFYHVDLARTLGEAKLGYAGSASLMDNFDQFSLGAEAAKLLAGIGDRALAETVRDFVRNQVFRRDVFTRGSAKASAPELEAALGRTRFALARPRSSALFKQKTAQGEIALPEAAYAPVLDALARAPMSFDELARAAETAQFDRVRLRQAVFGNAAFGNVAPALPAEGEAARRRASERFNAAILAKPIGTTRTVLASPVLGSGVSLSVLDRAFLQAPGTEGEGIDQARRALESAGIAIMKAGKTLERTEERDAVIEERAAFFYSALLPYLRQVGVTV